MRVSLSWDVINLAVQQFHLFALFFVREPVLSCLLHQRRIAGDHQEKYSNYIFGEKNEDCLQLFSFVKTRLPVLHEFR